MKIIIKLLFLLQLLIGSNYAFTRNNNYIDINKNRLSTLTMNKNQMNIFNNIKTHTSMINIKKKTEAVIKMIRPINIIPTLLLGISGGWIMNPNIHILIHTPSFFISNIILLLITSNSMIINDIFDIEVDRQNNPTRPLVTGDITIKEVTIISAGLFILTELINYIYIPWHLQHYSRLANLLIYSYTPFLKRIPLLKNLSC
jgi:4-hydroxybenzoate polyprenyltransferase